MLRRDLNKPPTEAMFEIIAVKQALKLAQTQLKRGQNRYVSTLSEAKKIIQGALR